MKKILSLIALLAICSLVIVSCGNDDATGPTSTLTITGSGS